MELQSIQNLIYEIRGQKVMLDHDLAMMYQVETRRLNEAVKRNIKRFPSDFRFQLTETEYQFLRSQIVTLNENGEILKSQFAISSLRSQFATLEIEGGKDRRGKHSKYLPYAFTEQGIAMLSGLLNSDIAIEINIRIMRVFVAMRNLTLEYAKNKDNKSLEERFKALEESNEELLKDINDLNEYTKENLDDIYIALAELADKHKKVTEVAEKPRKPIGYQHYNYN
jgi:hypothetical protein